MGQGDRRARDSGRLIDATISDSESWMDHVRWLAGVFPFPAALLCTALSNSKPESMLS